MALSRIQSASIQSGAARANFGAGAVLQVVQATTTTSATSTTTTYADTNLVATITPTSTSSKILVVVSQAVETYASNSTHMGLRILRGAIVLFTNERVWGDNTNAANDLMGTASISYLDSPNSTDALTYKTQFSRAQNTSGSYGNYCAVQPGGGITPSTITLMEIAG